MRSRLSLGVSFAAVFAFALLVGGPVLAQKYPEKPVRMMVPFPAGGPLDVAARMFSVRLAERFGQPFVVENRPGAGGNIGMEVVMKAPPDGHTLLWAIDSMLTVNPLLYRELSDPLERLTPVGLLTENRATLVVHPSLGVRTVAEFVKLSHARDLSYGSAGLGSPGHRTMEYFKLLTGARVTHVPYKGNAPAVQSLVAGQTHAFITPISPVISHIRSGKLTPLVVTSGTRSAALPNVPTMVELGHPKFNIVVWYSVLVPQGTPQPIVQALEQELGRIMALPDVRAAFEKVGNDPIWDKGAAVITRAKEERALWAEVIQKTGMKIE